ncbi:PAS domain S-box protein [Candidatus Synechococcus calcipolaris G9]|uniref:PAS domain S-box protein n=1 Tax=Candidatus Synechococcus calcipolaris G9 TaxID=1497997 RepID=A0ABT6F1V5_9SYNE|nr:PAS domain S-box protein [Candidatus Synechococcus calcipolaris]MDG2991807.1 PAS domain S-box protein [Candidatus Synechococcus calcipolaris G9]
MAIKLKPSLKFLSVSWGSLGLRWKLTFVLVLIATIPSLIITESISVIIKNSIQEQQEKQLQNSLDELIWELKEIEHETTFKTRLISYLITSHPTNLLGDRTPENKQVLKSFLQEFPRDPTDTPMSFVIIADASGDGVAKNINLLAQDHSQYPDLQLNLRSNFQTFLVDTEDVNISGLPIVQAAQDQGELVSGIELVDNAFLSKLGLGDQVKIPLRHQPHNALPEAQKPSPLGTYAAHSGDMGLVVMAAQPIYEDDQFQGMVLAGVLLNRLPDLVDRVSYFAEPGTVATLFAHDVRISTNVPYRRNDNTRALGTRVSQAVAQKVLEEGQVFRGVANILGRPHISIYQPAYDHRYAIDPTNAQPIGILFVGKSQSLVNQLLMEKQLLGYSSAAIALLVACLVAYLMGKAIAQPISDLAELTNQARKGDLGIRARVSSRDEVGVLAASFNSMMNQLQQSFTILENKNTDLEKIRDSLITANEQFEAVLNAVPGSISWINAEGIYMGVNHQLARTLNLPKEQFIGKRIGFLQEDDALIRFLEEFVNSDEPYTSQVIQVIIKGEYRYYLIAAQKYKQGSQTVSVGIDITDRIRAEESLRLAEESYRSIFENALEGIFQSVPSGQFIRVNQAMADILGYDSPEQLMSEVTNIGEQLYVDQADRDEFRRRLADKEAAHHFEYKAYRRDRQIIWVQLDARRVEDSNGESLYYEGIVQDISQRKQREAALERQINDLKVEIDQEKRRKEVAAITETDYFQHLRDQARKLRQRPAKIDSVTQEASNE